MIPKEILADPDLKTECEETDRLALEILEGKLPTNAIASKPLATGYLKQSKPRILFDQPEPISPEERKSRDQAHIEKYIRHITENK